MGLENANPELVYATKGNIAYPASGGIDGVQTAAQLASRAQARLADAVSGSLFSAQALITTAISASTATTSLAIANGLVLNSVGENGIPNGATVSIVTGNNVVTTTLTAAAAAGATSLSVSSFTVPWAIPVGASVVWGEVAASLGPGPNIAAQ